MGAVMWPDNLENRTFHEILKLVKNLVLGIGEIIPLGRFQCLAAPRLVIHKIRRAVVWNNGWCHVHRKFNKWKSHETLKLAMGLVLNIGGISALARF